MKVGRWAAAGISAAWVGGAAAQSAPPAPTPATEVEAVVVTSDRPQAQTTLEARRFSLARDLQAASGSAEDVLRHIPSVDVDTSGSVTLRGDPNVQVLIDGKPSPLMSPANRAAALEQMGADQIDHIEVLANPSARYKPDGASGVINIVLKHSRKRGATGVLQASQGSEGRYSLGASGAWRSGPLNLTGSFTARHDTRKREISDARSGTDPLTGAPTTSDQAVTSETRRLSLIESVGADYDLTRRDRLSAAASYNDRTGKPVIVELDQAADPAGPATSDYLRLGGAHEREINTQASAKYRHLFGADDHAFSLDYQRGETLERQGFDYANRYAVPAGPPSADNQHLHTDERVQELTAEYVRPLPGKASLVAGYDFERDDGDYDNHGANIDAATGAPVANPALTNRFIYSQAIHALYATYERPMGRWRLLGGLRGEETLLDTDQATTGQPGRQAYLRLYPSLHAQYGLSDFGTLRFSFSRRVDRPRAEFLNPYPVYQDAFDLRAGDARLMPQQTWAFEASYEYGRRSLSWQVNAYFRDITDAIVDVSRYVSPGVLLTTKANSGQSLNGGLELSGHAQVTRRLGVALSGNVYYSRLDVTNLGLAATPSLVSFTGKASLDYDLSPCDRLQISGNGVTRQVTAQGFRLPSYGVNIGYRRKLSERLTLVTTVADLFATQRDRLVIDTPALHDAYSRRVLGRTVWAGLTWTLGGGKPAAQGRFDYGSGG